MQSDKLGDTCIQIFHLGWYIDGYMGGNSIRSFHLGLDMITGGNFVLRLDIRPYI